MAHRMDKLSNLVKLSCQVRIYVPSTTAATQAADTSGTVDATLEFLSVRFGGATSYTAMGCWKSPEHGLIKEKVIICESYTDTHGLEENIEAVIERAEALKAELSQEAIAIEVMGEMYFV